MLSPDDLHRTAQGGALRAPPPPPDPARPLMVPALQDSTPGQAAVESPREGGFARPARITYDGDNVIAEVEPPGTTLLDVSIRHKVPHFRECGGRGRCTTCRVEVIDGLAHLTERTEREARVAEARGWGPNVRLACQTSPLGDVRVRRLVRTPADVSLLQTEALRDEPGREAEVAILACDIREFTPFAEGHLSFDVVHVLNRFFGHLGEPILLNNGVIYQYVGDQVIGLFGVDGTSPVRSCLQAVRAGLGMLDALGELNRSLEAEFGVRLDIRIGVHFGRLVVGYLGHPSRRVFSAIGDAMNVAARIEEANKELGTRFLVSGALFARLPVALETGARAEVELKGKQGRHVLVEVRGFVEPDADLLVQTTARQLLGAQSQFAERFYRRLFAAAPGVRALFGDNMEAQGQMLTQTLQLAVYGLSRFDSIAPGLAVLGRRHTGYGVQPEHYSVFLDVFVQTAAEVLGDAFTPEVGEAWRAALGLIMRAMHGEEA